jgi:nucleotide-binding universal stress UspA family protein
MFHRLLVAFDGSPYAQRALAEAIDLAQTNNGRLTVMTLVPEPSAWTLGGRFDVPISLSELNQQIRQEYRTMLDAAVATVPRGPPPRAGSAFS